ncbi:terpene synthase 10-like [Jatropha curcas]|uniref:terpene synthase 10-like n=1 Tax=Jatropha curcas TaxID=180498 RepID=UPI001893EC4C|nr:terpene synthase 10-like [Jatropha curcas]
MGDRRPGVHRMILIIWKPQGGFLLGAPDNLAHLNKSGFDGSPQGLPPGLWWLNVGLGEKLSFARDRLMENFLWTIGMIFEPEFGYCRRMSTKVNVLLTTIDNVYDVYGTLDELELFTDAVERWDVNAIEQLPDYMKICLLTLYNTINELAYDTFKEQGLHILPYLKKFVLINNVLKSFVMVLVFFMYNDNYSITLMLSSGQIYVKLTC